MNLIYPQPRNMYISEGEYPLPRKFVLLFEYGGIAEKYDMIQLFADRCKKLRYECYPLPDYAGDVNVDVKISKSSQLDGEHYTLQINELGVQIFYGTCEAAFRALTSLIQMIKNSEGKLPYCKIDDSPDIKNRGYLYDISRDRVPQLKEIFRVIDILADLKYNQLQLYLEQPAFEFAAYPQYAKDIEALTPGDVLQIDAYCKRRYIRLIPNQNSFGHIHLWMIKPQLAQLSALPDGYALNPLNEDCYCFLNKLYDSLLPCFQEDTFNVGCDEVSELDRDGSRTKEACQEAGGAEKIYLKHVLKVYDVLKQRGKKMMMWADIIVNHEDLLSELPKDIIPLIWGYAYDTDLAGKAKIVARAGFPFYICPGTSSWASPLSDLENARQNIKNAVDACLQYNAAGILLTDWGDVGSACFPVLSYQSIVWCAAISWCKKTNDVYENAGRYTDKEIFGAENESFSELIYQASGLLPKYCNCTDPIFSLLLEIDDFSDADRIPFEDFEKLLARSEQIVHKATRIRLHTENAARHIDEFCADMQIFDITLRLLQCKYRIRRGENLTLSDLSDIEQQIREAKVFYRRIWSENYKITGWYGLWWFIDRQINKFKRYLTKDDAYDILINDNKELGI